MVQPPAPVQPNAGPTTRDRLIDALRWGDLTVDELAGKLGGVTLNGVRAQLTALQRDGLVRRTGLRYAGVAGKPPVVYGLTRAAREEISRAYPPALSALIEEVGEQLGAERLEGLLTAAGRRLGRAIAGSGPAEVLESLGARVAVEMGADGVATVRGAGCPLGTVVAERPVTCELVRSLLATSLGTQVSMCCEHGDSPACRFRVGATSS
jgi:predicted ArsR family transcriptional regulator